LKIRYAGESTHGSKIITETSAEGRETGMGKVDSKLASLDNVRGTGYWGQRIVSELQYARRLSRIEDGSYDDLIERAAQFLLDRQSDESTITMESALKVEDMISQLSAKAKAFKMVCAGHAHIDMNWMWRWDETVAITLDTFRTMLDLMEEYPQFTFSQSQASVYRIVEQYAPEMVEEIKARVKEGRWEVTASTWVEADKNMPSGESMARHILYTKQYLSRLLDIDPHSLNIDFEPDTFGHSVNVPEILAGGGVRYYYHCRGDEGHNIAKWTAPSGRSVIVYREPFWYNAAINPDMVLATPEFCRRYNLDTMLKVYGVGDHGGGPTRRDIEKIIDMNRWPVFPEIRFGTFGEFFSLVDKVEGELPEVSGERNFIFTGCYTSQSRIKMANRIGEAALNEAEAYNTIAALTAKSRYSNEAFASAWENILFNQFHDIIPGSGVIDTREYAMGLFQDTMATAGSSKKLALQRIASQIDTASLAQKEDIKDTVSEGAGVGFGVEEFKVSQSSRASGKTRLFQVFNPSPVCREDLAEITVWDWEGDLSRITFTDGSGNPIDHQLLDHGVNNYWGHSYVRVLIKATVPAYGYSTYVMTEEQDIEAKDQFPRDPRLERVIEPVLENDYMRVVFDTQNCSIISLVDKRTGEELVDAGRPAGIFRLIQEDPRMGMTAWRVGRYMNIEDLIENVKITNLHRSSLRQTLSYEIGFASSKLKVDVSLNCNSPRLDYSVECDWHEVGKPRQSVPQLNFYLPAAYACASYKYDVPFGVIKREPLNMDVPANSWMLGAREDSGKSQLMLVTGSKYGFRGYGNSLALTLIRSSYDPDPYPEIGVHNFNFCIYIDTKATNKDLIGIAYDYNHPFTVISSRAHEGSLPASQAFMALEEGSVAISAVKVPENANSGNELLVRVYETEGQDTRACLSFSGSVQQASLVDINEEAVDAGGVSIDGNRVSFDVSANSVTNLRLTLSE